MPLQEQMKPLLELFPRSADATNLSETMLETTVLNKQRSVPADARYLQPPFPAEAALLTHPALTNEKPDSAAQMAEFRSLVAQERMGRAWVLYTKLTSAHFAMDFSAGRPTK